jgi:2-keto-4-pentenoate hydratase/2-oxohepta-3-ene-1,7-dioic acid hydratase in catechol pathway
LSKPFKIENIYCVGRNYAKHAKELENELPTTPLFFQKSNSTVNTGNTIDIKKNQNIEHELEVVIKINKDGTPSNIKEARSYISGFTIGLDLTNRKLQADLKKKGLPWFTAKSFRGAAVVDDNFITNCPGGFYLTVNEKLKQKGKIKNMIFTFEEIVLSLSKSVDLKDGDLIFTGTPEGVGPLKRGDQVEIGFINHPPKKLVVI